jgi:6-pyruvoyltetrahydropterin/6-carboxytetrahydropterin synthase
MLHINCGSQRGATKRTTKYSDAVQIRIGMAIILYCLLLCVEIQTGFVMNLKDLSTIIKQEVTEKLDHKNLNLDVPFLEGIMTSTEHIVIAIWKILEPRIAEYGAELSKLKLVETENNFVEYFGGKQPY